MRGPWVVAPGAAIRGTCRHLSGQFHRHRGAHRRPAIDEDLDEKAARSAGAGFDTVPNERLGILAIPMADGGVDVHVREPGLLSSRSSIRSFIGSLAARQAPLGALPDLCPGHYTSWAFSTVLD